MISTTYAPGKLLMITVGRGKGETVMAVAKKAGARGGTILLGKGMVENRLLRLLGLDDQDLDVVLILLAREEMPPVLEALSDSQKGPKMRGMLVCLDVAGILRRVYAAPAGSVPQSDTENAVMSCTADYELISVIANAGFAGDIMEAARKAGAPGGTVINARGTGREEDITFFGITIVPEKEFIMILAPKAIVPAVLDAIRSIDCLNQPGVGIAFSMNVEHFETLGKR